jgi:hypothetical protein
MTDAEIIEGLRRIGAETEKAPPNFVHDLMRKIREDRGEKRDEGQNRLRDTEEETVKPIKRRLRRCLTKLSP